MECAIGRGITRAAVLATMTDDSPSPERSKVGRLIAEYELSGAGETLERRWTAETDDRWSLRDLADWFNKQLLGAVLDRHGQQSAVETIDATYRFLTDDDVSPTARTQTSRDLERQGIDVDELRNDFVTHQAVHNYLTTYRNASLGDDARSASPDEIEQTINRLQNKTATVTESNVDRQRASGNVDIGAFDVLVTIEIICNECGDSFTFGQLMAAGGCSCRERV